MLIVELLAALSIAAAVGMRIALPLLLIGLLQGERLWNDVPVLSQVPPTVVMGVLVSWALFELFALKDRVGRRVLQLVQTVCAPVVGAIAAIAIARITEVPPWMFWIISIIGGLVALVLQLVQLGWFYRRPRLPMWAVLGQDLLCICLVLFAFDAPEQGGLIALILLWLAIRSSQTWRRWYVEQASPKTRHRPRRYKQEPD